MANIFRFPSRSTPLMSKNQQLLAEINAKAAAVSPEQKLISQLKGAQETLQGAQRQYDRLVEEAEANGMLTDPARRAQFQPRDDAKGLDR
jgi:hypothetical protein